MARSVTLASLRSQVRQRADQVNSGFVSTPELDGYINSSVAELRDLLVTRDPDRYVDSYDLTTASGTGSYALPSDFYELRGVDVQLSSGDWAPVDGFAWNARNRSAGPTSPYGPEFCYRLRGDELLLTPPPTSGRTVRLWYVPAAPMLTGSADTLDGVNGWEEYVVVDSAIKCMQKEESDVSVLMAQKAALVGRIETMTTKRDRATPPLSTDIYESQDPWPWAR